MKQLLATLILIVSVVSPVFGGQVPLEESERIVTEGRVLKLLPPKKKQRTLLDGFFIYNKKIYYCDILYSKDAIFSIDGKTNNVSAMCED